MRGISTIHLCRWYEVNDDFVAIDSGLYHLWQIGTVDPGLTLQKQILYLRQGQSLSAMIVIASTNT